jgi:ankyrin repeat protein
MLEKPNFFKQIPPDITLDICIRLTPEDTDIFGQTDKHIHAITTKDAIWEFHLEFHFHGDFLELNSEIFPNEWRNTFIEIHQQKYKHINEIKIRKCISRVKEKKDFSGLAMTVADLNNYSNDIRTKLFTTLIQKDSDEKSIIDFAREKNYPPTLKQLYEIFVAFLEFFNKRGLTWRFSTELVPNIPLNNKLEIAIIFRQDIADLLLSQKSHEYHPAILSSFAVDGKLNSLEFFIRQKKTLFTDNYMHSTFGVLYLLAAAFGGHLPIVQYLLQNKVNPNGKMYGGFESAVEIATLQGHLEVIKFLLDNGATLFTELEKYIYSAAKNGHLKVVQYFLEKKLTTIDSPEKKTEYLERLLFDAIWFGYLPLVKLLFENKNINQPIADTLILDSLLSKAIKHNKRNSHLAVIKYLIDQGANPLSGLKETDHDIDNPFYFAIVFGNLGTAKFLNEKFPELLQKIKDKNLLLVIAATLGVNSQKTVAYLSSQNLHIDASTLRYIKNSEDTRGPIKFECYTTYEAAYKQTALSYFKNTKSTIAFIKKLNLLEDATLESVLGYAPDVLIHYQHLINTPGSLVQFFQHLPPQKFNRFFVHVILRNICCFDDFIAAASVKSPLASTHCEKNQQFIQKYIAPFIPYQKKIHLLLAELNAKITKAGMDDKRKDAICDLVKQLTRETNNFFLNPRLENINTLLTQCEKIIKASNDAINHPSLTASWGRAFCFVLLAIAHIFIITIPIIWLVPASRNLLMAPDKTDTGIKADHVLEGIREFYQVVQEGKFNGCFFNPVKNDQQVITQKPLESPQSPAPD